MDKLPSKSLSKSILIAIPLFCLIIAILDTSDELSYLFILEFLDNMAGTPDITFLPSNQPQIGQNYQQQQLFKAQHITLMDSINNGTQIPMVRKNQIDKWADQFEIIRGVSPRWLVPVVVGRTDSLILVSDISKQLAMGVGLKSKLQNLQQNQVAMSSQLLSKSGKKVGDTIDIQISIKNLFSGRRLIQKYQSVQSHDQNSLVEQKQLQIDQLSKYIYEYVKKQGEPYNISISEAQIKDIVDYVYNLEFAMPYKIKYEYQNKGLFSSALSNVVLMEFDGFSKLLSTFAYESLNSRQLQKLLFEQLDKSSLNKSQIEMIKNYYKVAKYSGTYQPILEDSIRKGVQENPLMMIASYKQRQLIYHPQKYSTTNMFAAMEASPGDFTVVSTYPLYEDLANIRFFFKSVIQIFTFVCGVIFFYTMRLILKQIYEQKEIEVGIWRTLGAGGVRYADKQASSESQPLNKGKLNTRLTLKERITYGYQMMVKVGFLYYWLVSCLISAVLYQVMKLFLYWIISDLFMIQAPPPQYLFSPVILFLLVFGFTVALIVMHIRQIYINPLVSTIKPVKRTFDLVKVRVIKIATFGITIQILITGLMLVYYGVVSYYWIPLSILQDDGDLQTILFNSIFIFLILGGIMLLVILQSKMECWVLNLMFYMNKHLSTLKLIMLKSIKAKQYKNIKVSLIISLIFAFLLFITCGINVELKIIESFSERQIGADLMIENLQKKTLNRTAIEDYLNGIEGIKYAWFSQNLQRKQIKMGFQTITKKGTTTCAFRAVTPSYLDIAFYQYYYPQFYYEPTLSELQVLPNGVKNGYTTLYRYDGKYNNESIGRYDPSNTITSYDPHNINVPQTQTSAKVFDVPHIPENQQVINIIITSLLRRRMAARPGDYFILTVNTTDTHKSFFFRCRVTHTIKVAPGVDLFRSFAYMSQEQASYIFKAIGRNQSELHYNKLFITGVPGLKQIGNRILSMSPQHTQVVQISQVRESFELIQKYLNGFVLFITVILAVLSVLFLTVYTYGKCKEEAQVFKMLRAIGMPVSDIRLMIYLEILVRMLISILNGVLLGLVFSLGLSGNVEQVLMLKAPLPSLNIVIGIAVVLLFVFSATVIKSTSYLTKRTVLETAKM